MPFPMLTITCLLDKVPVPKDLHYPASDRPSPNLLVLLLVAVLVVGSSSNLQLQTKRIRTIVGGVGK